jgi:PTS system nitrogen regulatory IIA component
MSLRDLLDESVIKVGLESIDKEECFEEMVDILVRVGRVTDREGALIAIRERESHGTTGIGHGIAIPHGKVPAIESLTAALGISKEGVEFDAVDGKKAHLVFLLLARVNNPGPHVRALAEIARTVRSPEFCRKLLEGTSAKDVMSIIEAEG